MPSPLPTPVAAALGIVPTVLGGVRRLPGKAVQLPVFAVSSALTTLDTARREYDALAERGERLVARLRGQSFDELEDRFEDALQGTPLAKPYDAVEDALEDATENVTALVRNAPAAVKAAPAKARKAASSATKRTGQALDKAADAVEDAAQTVTGAAEDAADATVDAAAEAVARAEKAAAEAAERTAQAAERATETATAAGVDPEVVTGPAAGRPKGAPTPKATQPDDTRIDTAASADVVEAVERVSGVVGGTVLAHDDLPLPDYDHMTLGSLRGRMRSLDLPQLVQIRDYEKAHADRLPIVTMLDNRIAKLAADPTAPLSGSSPADAGDAPDKARAGRTGSSVKPATGGPAQNPPSAGVPTNPSQPRDGAAGTNPDSNA